MEKLFELLSSAESTLAKAEQLLDKASQLIPNDDSAIKKLENLKEHHKKVAAKLKTEQIRLLEFLGKFLVLLEIERTPIWHKRMEFFGFKLEEGFLRARVHSAGDHRVLYENTESAVNNTHDFPLQIVFEKLFIDVKNGLAEMDKKATRNSDQLSTNISELLKQIEEMKSRVTGEMLTV